MFGKSASVEVHILAQRGSRRGFMVLGQLVSVLKGHGFSRAEKSQNQLGLEALRDVLSN
jgi:hypothetical protein